MLLRSLKCASNSTIGLVRPNSQFGQKHGPKVTQFYSTENHFQTHYEVLGIARTASPRDIKDAYLNLSKELHPDVANSSGAQNSDNNGSHLRFVQVNEAYSVLSKPGEKRIYDLGLHGQQMQREAEQNAEDLYR